MLPIRDALPTRSFPFVNYLLIALNVGAFLVEAGLVGDPAMVAPLVLVPAHLVAHPMANVPSLFGHMFLHAGLGHLAGNMLFLWIFGDNVEDALGHVRYAVFYLTCGLAAAFAQVMGHPWATIPMVGASGAIAGVLAAYGRLYPWSPITVLNPIPILWLFWGLFIHLPAWVVILEFFGLNLWNVLTTDTGGGGVAFMAHVGGFVFGFFALRWMMKREPVRPPRWDGVRSSSYRR